MSPAAFVRGDNIDRIQGIDSSLNDLVLHDGRQFAVEVGAAITPTPTISRTIDGSSSVKFSIRDHDLDFLDAEMLSQKLDAQIDGLWFRYMGADLDGPQIDITMQDREIAILSEFTEPTSAYRKDMTRAEWIVSLVRKALPHVPIFCPQLHVVQPIETERQGKKAKDDAKANRGKGLGDAKGLTVKGVKATPAQIEIGERAARTIASYKSPFRVGVATFAALIVESGLGAFSSNYMQMIDSTAAASKYSPTVIEEAVTGFLKGYINGEGGALAYFNGHPNAEPHRIAQEAQQSGAGEATQGAANYGPWTAEARAWLEAFEGGEFSAEGASRTVTEPYKFEITKEDKNWWEGIKREAKAVNWRAFFVAGRFFYIDEIELFRGMVRWAIDRETPGIQKVKGSWRANRPATDITIEAFASHWKVPPGGVATLGGYGPFSTGFGDAPIKANSQGQRIGISSNRKAATGEGRARYLVETIEAPLRDSDVSDLKLVTVKLRKPTAPLPEPAAKTKTLASTGAGGAEGGASADALADVSITNATPGPPYWGGAAAVFKQFVHPFMEGHGLSPGAEKEQGHEPDGDHDPEGQPSGYATDYPTGSGEQIARALARAMGNPGWQPNSYTSFTIKVDGYSFQVQILWGAEIDHADHIHVGMHRV